MAAPKALNPGAAQREGYPSDLACREGTEPAGGVRIDGRVREHDAPSRQQNPFGQRWRPWHPHRRIPRSNSANASAR